MIPVDNAAKKQFQINLHVISALRFKVDESAW